MQEFYLFVLIECYLKKIKGFSFSVSPMQCWFSESLGLLIVMSKE